MSENSMCNVGAALIFENQGMEFRQFKISPEIQPKTNIEPMQATVLFENGKAISLSDALQQIDGFSEIVSHHLVLI